MMKFTSLSCWLSALQDCYYLAASTWRYSEFPAFGRIL